MLVDKGSNERIPKYIDKTNHKEHRSSQSGRFCCITTKHINVSVEEQQIHTNSLINQILGKVTGTEADALHPRQLVEAFCFVCCCHNDYLLLFSIYY